MERVDRILLQLSRFYNPYVDQPIVDLANRRAVLEALQVGQGDRAREILAERLRLYARFEDTDRES